MNAHLALIMTLSLVINASAHAGAGTARIRDAQTVNGKVQIMTLVDAGSGPASAITAVYNGSETHPELFRVYAPENGASEINIEIAPGSSGTIEWTPAGRAVVLDGFAARDLYHVFQNYFAENPPFDLLKGGQLQSRYVNCKRGSAGIGSPDGWHCEILLN